jgi:hypothetical protein
MKRNRLPRRARQTPDSELLTRLATRLSQSSNRIEDAYWEARLATHIDRLLADGAEETLIAVLDQLYSGGSRAYDELADMVESCAETRRADASNGLDAVMIAVPLLAWSRFQIPSGSIPAAQMDAVRVHLQAHVLAADAKLGLCDVLYSPDQLPQNYVDTAQLAEKLTKAAIHGRNLKVDPAQLPETMNFLSDTRYLLGAVAAPRGTALFRWQEDDGDPAECFRQWSLQGGEALRPLLPACAIEFQPVLAYHAAVRDADPRLAALVLACRRCLPADCPQPAGDRASRRGCTFPRPATRGIPHRLHPTRRQRRGTWRGLAIAGTRG